MTGNVENDWRKWLHRLPLLAMDVLGRALQSPMCDGKSPGGEQLYGTVDFEMQVRRAITHDGLWLRRNLSRDKLKNMLTTYLDRRVCCLETLRIAPVFCASSVTIPVARARR